MIDLKTFAALSEAAQIYDGLKRKGSGTPYIAHAHRVFYIVCQYSNDTPTQVAALFHDFFKRKFSYDSSRPKPEPYDYQFLAAQIGIPAARLVDEICPYRAAKEEAGASWSEKKYKDLDNFTKLSPAAQLIFVANQIDNLTCLVEDYKNSQTKIWEVFGSSEEQMALYYAAIMAKIVAGFRHPIIADYYEIFREACLLFSWPEVYEKGVKNLAWAKGLREEK